MITRSKKNRRKYDSQYLERLVNSCKKNRHVNEFTNYFKRNLNEIIEALSNASLSIPESMNFQDNRFDISKLFLTAICRRFKELAKDLG